MPLIGRDGAPPLLGKAAQPESQILERETQGKAAFTPAVTEPPRGANGDRMLDHADFAVPSLLPESAPLRSEATVILPARARGDLPAQSNAEADGTQTEVHVHIGRIDISAIQEFAPSGKSRAAQRHTLPLADYLARRKHR